MRCLFAWAILFCSTCTSQWMLAQDSPRLNEPDWAPTYLETAADGSYSGAHYCFKPNGGFHIVDYDEDSESWFDILFGDLFGGAVVGILKGTGLVALHTASAFTSVSFGDEEPLPVWEAQVNSYWYFESRMHRSLATGSQTINSKAFDLQGSPGFQTRLIHQTFYRLATEYIFDFYSDSDRAVYSDITELHTNPGIPLPNSVVHARRSTGLYSGQINFLLRNNPSVFSFAGLRWWHHQDRLGMAAVVPDIRWQIETQTNAPLVQVGVQFGNLGRLSWRNRYSLGMGPAIGRATTEVTGVVGAVNRFGSDATKLAVLGEMRSELGYSVNHWLSLQAGAQLSAFSASLRPAKLIDGSDFTTGRMGHRTDDLLLSGLYFGLTLVR